MPRQSKGTDRTAPVDTRFDNRLPIREAGRCWEWVGGLNAYGYGIFRDGKKILFAHRFAYERWVGLVPEGLCVLHHCDNRKCANPEHLWTGTRRQNGEDRDRKGRTASG